MDDDYDRGSDHPAPAKPESDPLAELARLIGQTDPFAMGRANQQVQPRSGAHDRYQPPADEEDDSLPSGPPPWMQRAARHEAPPQDEYEQEDHASAVHPLHRYATPVAAPEPEYHQAPAFTEADQPLDPSRYDDALYGQIEADARAQHEQAYSDDPYTYHDGYDDAPEEPVKKRGGGMITVAVVLALAVVGTGAAFAYRTYVGSPRSGEPPIIKADNSPTKIIPTPADGTAKVPDRLASGDGTERIVPREEAPVDVNAKAGPRVVFPPLNPNGSPPSVASIAPGLSPANAGNGTLSSNEPRKIKTLAVRSDQPDGAATPVGAPSPARPTPAPRTTASAANANASANAPLSLAPQTGQPAPATRVATTSPLQTAPGASGGGGYLVQVSSQRNEADAQASYRALQGKFPSVLGSRAPVIKRADLGEKGVYYRAMVGPFGSPEEASHFCGNLKTAGGQCVIQRN